MISINKSNSRTKHTYSYIKTKKKTKVQKTTKYNTKYNTKNNTKNYKINVYAKNMRYFDSDLSINSNNNDNYNENKDKHKILLSQLVESLGENQWLKVSKNKYKPITHIDKRKLHGDGNDNNYVGQKPQGSYYSKGSWLFHRDNWSKLNNEIIFVEVDYKTIYRITGKEPYKSPLKNSIYQNTMLDFMTKYGIKYGKDKCVTYNECFFHDTEDECNKDKLTCYWDSNKYNEYKKTKGKCIENNICRQFTTETKCKSNKQSHCMFMHAFKYINWLPLYKNYNGFAMYPYPEYKLLTVKKHREDFFVLKDYDVETLVLWDHTPVMKHRNFGTIKEILRELGVKDKAMKNKDISSFFELLIPQLIKKINETKFLEKT